MIARLLAATLIASVLVAPATVHAAPPGPWKTMKTTDLDGDEGFTDLAVGGRKSAWAFGRRLGARKTAPLSLHWNGRTWRNAPLPRGVRSDERPTITYGRPGTRLSASSAKNAWAFTVGDYRFGPARD